MSEDYCRIDARDRLIKKGFSITEAIDISDDVYQRLKNDKGNTKNGPACGCKTSKV